MSPIFYAINIATLATWLSVAAFGTVGVVIPTAAGIIADLTQRDDPYADLDLTVLTEDFTTGPETSSQATDAGTTGSEDEAEVPAVEAETLPTPPEMPEVTEFAPLPEIPDLPKKAAVSTVSPEITRKPKPDTKTAVRSSNSNEASRGSTRGKPGAAGTPGNGGRNGGSGMSDAQRLAGGRMPGPAYPAEARARGQSGTVIVEFVVGENGSVTSAYAKKPCPWPILNERAVSCVRRWKFPPGKVARYSRPIVFKLN